MGRTTIKDIALAANVSITTVSHALNGTRYVSPTTRAQIEELARTMGYRPDPIARMLQGQDSLLIGHILSDLLSNPFFGLVATGADQRAQEVGYATLLSHVGCHPDAERRAVEILLEKRVNGIIFTTPKSAESVQMAVSAGVSTVMIERPLPVRGAHAIVVDHRSGLRDLTRALIAQGHRRLAYIGGDFAIQGSEVVERQRLRGFRDALNEAGVAMPRSNILLVPYDMRAARAACQALLQEKPFPTALVIGSDLLAAGVCQVLYERGVHVPADLSVAGFDNTLGPYMAPPLTEVEPPTEEMGRRAVDLIVADGGRAAPAPRGQRVVLQPHLHVRASTRPLEDSGGAGSPSAQADNLVVAP